MNHARQCAMRIVNKRTRNTPARAATVVHRIDMTVVSSSLLFLGCSLAFARGCSLDVWVPGAVSSEGKSSTRFPLGPSCSVRIIGGSTSHLRSFSFSWRSGVVGKGGSHGFRGLGAEIVLSLDESVPSVIGRFSSLLCCEDKGALLRCCWCCIYRGICTLRIEVIIVNTLATRRSACIMQPCVGVS
jgi:hypothetical protein